jgi:WD40 repeat protein
MSTGLMLKRMMHLLIVMSILSQLFVSHGQALELVERLSVQMDQEILFIQWNPVTDQIAVLGIGYLTIDILDASTGETVAQFATIGGVPSGMAWSPDGRYLAAIGIFGYIEVWDVAEQNNIAEFSIEEATGKTFFNDFTTDLAWHPSENRLVIAGGNSGREFSIWDFSENYFIEREGRISPDFITTSVGVAWLGNEDELLISGKGCELAVVDPNDLQVIRNLDYGLLYDAPIAPAGQETRQTSQLFDLSPDGSQLAQFCNASRDEIVFRDLQSGAVDAVFTALDSETYAVAWSPQGDLLASAHKNGHLKLWDLSSNELLLDIEAHSEAVTTVTWNADGTALATASLDGMLRIWELEETD